jgi:hypothetical protein
MEWKNRVLLYILENQKCEMCGKAGKKVTKEEDPIFKNGRQKKLWMCTKCYYKRIQGG